MIVTANNHARKPSVGVWVGYSGSVWAGYDGGVWVGYGGWEVSMDGVGRGCIDGAWCVGGVYGWGVVGMMYGRGMVAVTSVALPSDLV